MAKPQVKLNIRGINALMSSAPVQSLVEERARRIAEAAGSGFEAVAAPHPWTARAYVRTADAEGRRREAQEKVLTRSISAGS
jgi:hypothetical protein